MRFRQRILGVENLLEHALPAFFALIDPIRIGALLAGMAVGMIFGMLPGLGGVAAVSILLPFIYLLDDYSGQIGRAHV